MSKVSSLFYFAMKSLFLVAKIIHTLLTHTVNADVKSLQLLQLLSSTNIWN